MITNPLVSSFRGFSTPTNDARLQRFSYSTLIKSMYILNLDTTSIDITIKFYTDHPILMTSISVGSTKVVFDESDYIFLKALDDLTITTTGACSVNWTIEKIGS